MEILKTDAISIERQNEACKQIMEQSRTISYDTVNLTVEFLIEKFNWNKEIPGVASLKARLFVIPDYQRNTVWDDSDRSAFIESILLGLPIPFLVFCRRNDGTIEIVDGVQRVTALYSFTSNGFALQKLSNLTSLNGFMFRDLTSKFQRKILKKVLRITMLDGDTRIKTCKDLSIRMYNRGRKIDDAEVRRGVAHSPDN
jgi:uncharacterized protein with ParB-like and HNH nuclease domain